MSRREVPLASRLRRSSNAVIAAALLPASSNVVGLTGYTCASKPLRSTIVSSQSPIIASASFRVRPCVIASSNGTSASHQRPSRVTRPSNRITFPRKPVAESHGPTARESRGVAGLLPRAVHPSTHRGGRRFSVSASRIQPAGSQARDASRWQCTPICVPLDRTAGAAGWPRGRLYEMIDSNYL